MFTGGLGRGGQDHTTNVLSVTCQVTGWPWQNIDVIWGEELLHTMSCVRSGIVLLKQGWCWNNGNRTGRKTWLM